MGTDHNMFLFHMNFRWLSKGNVTKQLCELREKLKSFFEEHSKIEFLDRLNDENWVTHFAYLFDIFEQLKKLNTQMEGKKQI